MKTTTYNKVNMCGDRLAALWAAGCYVLMVNDNTCNICCTADKLKVSREIMAQEFGDAEEEAEAEEE